MHELPRQTQALKRIAPEHNDVGKLTCPGDRMKYDKKELFITEQPDSQREKTGNIPLAWKHSRQLASAGQYDHPQIKRETEKKIK